MCIRDRSRVSTELGDPPRQLGQSARVRSVIVAVNAFKALDRRRTAAFTGGWGPEQHDTRADQPAIMQRRNNGHPVLRDTDQALLAERAGRVVIDDVRPPFAKKSIDQPPNPALVSAPLTGAEPPTFG